MENIKYGRRMEGRWIPIRAKAQDTRANPNSWETHLVRKRWDIGLLRALSARIMMMNSFDTFTIGQYIVNNFIWKVSSKTLSTTACDVQASKVLCFNDVVLLLLVWLLFILLSLLTLLPFIKLLWLLVYMLP